jgi:putative flippase GtrA
MEMVPHTTLRYALVGVSNTAVGFGVIWLAMRGLGFSDAAANITGFAIAFLWSFALNRTWTFRHHGAVGSGMLRYAAVCLMSYGANLSVVLLLGQCFGEGHLLVQICGMVTYSVLAYIGARVYAFPPIKASATG